MNYTWISPDVETYVAVLSFSFFSIWLISVAQPTFTLFLNCTHNSNEDKQNKDSLHVWADLLQIQKVKEWPISSSSDLTQI